MNIYKIIMIENVGICSERQYLNGTVEDLCVDLHDLEVLFPGVSGTLDTGQPTGRVDVGPTVHIKQHLSPLIKYLVQTNLCTSSLKW